VQLDDVLTELVADSGDRLLRVAYQLTHDRVAAQDLAQLWAVLGELSERQRAVLVLRYYEGLAHPALDGPLVSIDIAIGCYPEVGNTDLQSHSASSVLPVIQELLKAK
jgi:hypothetical protein